MLYELTKGRLLIVHKVVTNTMGGTRITKQRQRQCKVVEVVEIVQYSGKYWESVGRQSLALQVALPSREPV